VNLADVPIFELAERRLAWIDSRQRLLAQNIANADTPGWKPNDLGAFSADISQAQKALARTDPHHLPPAGGHAPPVRKTGGERAPDGNAVSLDDQLARLAETETAHDLASDLYKKYLGFFRLAIGR
jgi:flagellar basal-body rod protein FlgB